MRLTARRLGCVAALIALAFAACNKLGAVGPAGFPRPALTATQQRGLGFSPGPEMNAARVGFAAVILTRVSPFSGG